MENSSLRDNLSSPYHRITGDACCLCDIDLVIASQGYEEQQWIDYMYDFNSNSRTAVAYIDYKRMPSDKVLGLLPFYLSESQARKIPVPVFAVLCFLDPIYPVKCYYTVPVDRLAIDFFLHRELSVEGVYMSLQSYSKFHHSLRNKKWNGEETINKRNIDNILQLDHAAPIKDIKYLKDLPNNYKKYELPDLREITKIQRAL